MVRHVRRAYRTTSTTTRRITRRHYTTSVGTSRDHYLTILTSYARSSTLLNFIRRGQRRSTRRNRGRRGDTLRVNSAVVPSLGTTRKSSLQRNFYFTTRGGLRNIFSRRARASNTSRQGMTHKLGGFLVTSFISRGTSRAQYNGTRGGHRGGVSTNRNYNGRHNGHTSRGRLAGNRKRRSRRARGSNMTGNGRHVGYTLTSTVSGLFCRVNRFLSSY